MAVSITRPFIESSPKPDDGAAKGLGKGRPTGRRQRPARSLHLPGTWVPRRVFQEERRYRTLALASI